MGLAELNWDKIIMEDDLRDTMGLMIMAMECMLIRGVGLNPMGLEVLPQSRLLGLGLMILGGLLDFHRRTGLWA